MQALVLQLTGVLALAIALALGHGGSLVRTRPPAYHITGVPLAEVGSERGLYWCGPAALAAVLRFHGEEVTAPQIAKDIYLPGYRGTLNLDLMLWARRRGLQVWAGSGAPDEIRRAVSRDRPVICMVRRRARLADRNHFVIVRGYDDRRAIGLLDEGTGAERTAPMEAFERDWQECGHWMMVVEGKKPAHSAEGEHEGG
jgi:ABC-type bacteriocin/lantibiotic exporter with double-glycine peptidase domain